MRILIVINIRCSGSAGSDGTSAVGKQSTTTSNGKTGSQAGTATVRKVEAVLLDLDEEDEEEASIRMVGKAREERQGNLS